MKRKTARKRGTNESLVIGGVDLSGFDADMTQYMARSATVQPYDMQASAMIGEPGAHINWMTNLTQFFRRHNFKAQQMTVLIPKPEAPKKGRKKLVTDGPKAIILFDNTAFQHDNVAINCADDGTKRAHTAHKGVVNKLFKAFGIEIPKDAVNKRIDAFFRLEPLEEGDTQKSLRACKVVMFKAEHKEKNQSLATKGKKAPK